MNANLPFLISLAAFVMFLIVAAVRRSRLAGAVCLFAGLVTIVMFAVRDRRPPRAMPDRAAQELTPEAPSEPPELNELRLAELRPAAELADGYVSSDRCQTCHPHQHSTWHQSYHRTMTQLARPGSVAGEFKDQEQFIDGRWYRFSRKGDQFWVLMNNPDEESASRDSRAWCPVAITTGSHHMQICWYPAGQGRLLCQVPVVYLMEEQRWIPRSSMSLVPPGEPVSTEAGRWNETCIACHTTRGRPRIFDATQVDSRVAEFGISCEACHGPGEQHIRYHEQRQNPGPDDRQQMADTIVNPAALPHDLSSQVCGQCHSVSNSLNPQRQQEFMIAGDTFHPGERLSDRLHLIRRDDESRKYFLQFEDYRKQPEAIEKFFDQTFWNDGMVRVTGREYSGLTESACHQNGRMSCLSCHQLHQPEDDPRPAKVWANDQLKAGMDTDRSCLQCHSQTQYAAVSHTHHPLDSTGSRCYNCHMPHTSFGLLTAIRSHQISSPDVATEVLIGRPNACNICHLDQSLDWSARSLHDWYGTEPAPLDQDQQAVSAAVLWALKGDAGQRALAAWYMGWEPAVNASGSDWSVPYLIALLEDPYDAVRFIAARSLRRRSEFENVEYDFISPAGERQQAAERALDLWNARERPAESRKATVLIDASGKLQRDRFEQLLEERDNREIRIQE